MAPCLQGIILALSMVLRSLKRGDASSQCWAVIPLGLSLGQGSV